MISSFVIISLLSLLMFSTIFTGIQIKSNFNEYYFINDYFLKQSESLLNHEKIDIGCGLYFNSQSHINSAKTIVLNDKEIIITIGNGRFHYE